MSDDGRPKLVALVEGQSEAASVRVLLDRLLHRRQRFDVAVARPIRFERSRLTKPDVLEGFLQIASRDRTNAAGILVLLDVDDDCAAMLGPALLARAAAATPLPVRVVCAVREFEAWLLAASASLEAAGRIGSSTGLPTDPESVRDAKGRLRAATPQGRSYVEVSDQAAFVSVMDLAEAEARSPSFRKLVRDIDGLIETIPVR